MIDHLKFYAAMLCFMAAGFIVGVERGDLAQSIDWPIQCAEPCPDEFFDPWSGVTDCE